MFTILEGGNRVEFRGEAAEGGRGFDREHPRQRPHSSRNNSDKPARLLCMCTPSGQEGFLRGSATPSIAGPRRRQSSANGRGRPNASSEAKALAAKVSNRAVGMSGLIPGATGGKSGA